MRNVLFYGAINADLMSKYLFSKGMFYKLGLKLDSLPVSVIV